MSTGHAKGPDAEQIIKGLQQLLSFIASHPAMSDDDVRRRVTFNEIFAEIRAREAELGVEPAAVKAVRSQHRGVRHLEEQIAIEKDALGLVEDEQHWDLPVGFRDLPEYDAMLEAEEAWMDDHPDYVFPDAIPDLRAIVEQYRPKMEPAGTDRGVSSGSADP